VCGFGLPNFQPPSVRERERELTRGTLCSLPPPWRRRASQRLAFTRYSFTSGLLCTNQPSFYSPHPLAWPTLVQYYCTIISQYKVSLPTSRLYAIHHTILAITIFCKGQRKDRLGLTPGERPGRRLFVSVSQPVESTGGVSQNSSPGSFPRWATSPFGVTVSFT